MPASSMARKRKREKPASRELPRWYWTSIEDARFWAKMNKGNARGDVWQDVVRKYDRLAKDAGPDQEVEIRAWRSKIKRHPRFEGHAAVDVVLVPREVNNAPVKATRKRSRRRSKPA